MSKVSITTSLLDDLADAIGAKTGESTPMTIAEMTSAVGDITVPSGTISITSNGVGIDVAEYATANVSVSSPTANLQEKSVSYTPSETAQSDTVEADTGYDGLESVSVSVGAVSSSYVGSGIDRRSSTDLTASGATVTAPAGYYSSSASKAVASGSATTPATTVTANPSISVNSSTGVITASVSKTQSVTPTVSAGYVSSGTAGTITVSGSNTSNLSTQSGTTITPTTSQQTAVAAGKYTLGDVKVAAMPSGTAGTPSATKGTVSNHQVSVTPSVTNTTGYITGSTKTGTAVTVSASELVSGTLEITDNGTGIDVTNYAAVDVAIEGVVEEEWETWVDEDVTFFNHGSSIAGHADVISGFQNPALDDKFRVTYGTDTYICDIWALHNSPYIGNAHILYDIDPSGFDTEPTDTGEPFVFGGLPQWSGNDYFLYMWAETAGTRYVKIEKTLHYGVTLDILFDGSLYYSSSSVTTATATWTSDEVFVEGEYYLVDYNDNMYIVQAYLDSGIVYVGDMNQISSPFRAYVSNGVLTYTRYGSSGNPYGRIPLDIFHVVVKGNGGSSGGGGSSTPTMNLQAYMGVGESNATSLTATSVTLTVAQTGTYKVSWMAWRSTSSGTSGSQLYINGSAYGSENTTFTRTYGQYNELTNVSLTKDDVLVIRARARGSSYYMNVGNLIIQQTS